MRKSMLVIIFLVFICVGCSSQNKRMLKGLLDSITIETTIKDNVVLPESIGDGYELSWKLEENDYTSIGYSHDHELTLFIIKQDNNVHKILLSCTIKDGDDTYTKSFDNISVSSFDSDITKVTFSELISNKTLDKVFITGKIYLFSFDGFWITDGTSGVYIMANNYQESYFLGDIVSVIGTRHQSIEDSDTYRVHIDSLSIRLCSISESKLDYREISTDKTIEELSMIANDAMLFGTLYCTKGVIISDVRSNGIYHIGIKQKGTSHTITINDEEMSETTKKNLIANLGKYVELIVLYDNYHNNGYPLFTMIEATYEEIKYTYTDEEKVNEVSKIVSLMKKDIYEDISLPKKIGDYDGVKISWKSNKTKILSSDGKRGTSSNAYEDVVLTATISCGDISSKIENCVKVYFPIERTIREIHKDSCNHIKGMFLTNAKILSLDQYGYFFIGDTTGVTYVRTELEYFKDFKVGDSVTIEGKIIDYTTDNKNFAPKIFATKMVKAKRDVEVMDSIEIIYDELKQPYITNNVLTDSDRSILNSSKYIGSLINITGYIREVKIGDFTHYYICKELDNSEGIIYSPYNSNIDNIKEYVNMYVKIIAPMYDFSSEYGYRIGTFISLEKLWELE